MESGDDKSSPFKHQESLTSTFFNPVNSINS